jgi:diadenosine tetraphosphate (Ap4A) HIT family hydrolase
MIASGIPPSSDPAILRSQFGAAYPVLSTPVVVAFLDIAPLSRGHVLLCPRRHCAKSTDMTVAESAALGIWLPILTKAVLKAVDPEGSLETASWNIIQANGSYCCSQSLGHSADNKTGAEAGQTVPHSHFHIIPRLGAARDASDISDAERKNIALGEGPREKLADGEGTELSKLIKVELEKEIKQLRDVGDAFNMEEELHLQTKERGLKL